MLRGAFIGFGNVAAAGHLPGWQARNDVEIIAAADPMAARRQVFLAACPGGRWYDTVDDLLASEALDFVDICTPPASHGALIRRAVDAGLDVLCEKPLIIQPEDAVALVTTRAGRVVHSVHNWLQAPICRKITSLVAEGAIGSVRSIDWQTLRTRPAVVVGTNDIENWRVNPAVAGGGVLVDHGWHALYCVIHWTGSAPRGIAASLENRRFSEWPIEDTASLELGFDAGSGHIFLTWAADERANYITIEGDQGHIRVDGNSVIVTSRAGVRRWSFGQPLSEGSHHPDWFAGVAEDFLAAVGGRTADNLDEAVLCARLIGLAQRSSAVGGARLSVEG